MYEDAYRIQLVGPGGPMLYTNIKNRSSKQEFSGTKY